MFAVVKLLQMLKYQLTWQRENALLVFQFSDLFTHAVPQRAPNVRHTQNETDQPHRKQKNHETII